MRKDLTASERGLRTEILGCECGVVGDIFMINGEFSSGHFCRRLGSWTLNRVKGLTHKEMMEMFLKKYALGPG